MSKKKNTTKNSNKQPLPPILTTPVPLSRLQEVKDKMAEFLCVITEDEDLENPPAFALIRQGLIGQIYKIFLSKKVPAVKDFLYMHECGHVLFDHCDNFEKKSIGVSARIRAQYEKYKSWFNNEEEYFNYFKSYIFNVVEDLEVNSKLFTKAEFDQACNVMEEAGWGRGLWPEDYGYPIGKTWREYLTFVLQNMEEFLKNMKNQLSQQSQDGQGQQGKGSSSSSSSSKGNGKSKSSSGGGSGQQQKTGSGGDKFSDEELKRMKDEVANKGRSALEKTADEIEKKVAEAQKHDAEADSDGGKGIGDQHMAEESVAAKTKNWDELYKILSKEVFGRVAVMTKRDQMYNFNRKKLGGSPVLVPKDVFRTEYRADDFYVLLDVSGSVSQETVMNTTKLFNDFAAKFGRKSRLIMWDTSLCFDEEFRNINDVCVNGGGTDMASGIKYIAKNYHNSRKIFVISDFCDNLDAWAQTIKDCHITSIYGICWDTDMDIPPDLEKLFKKIWKVQLS